MRDNVVNTSGWLTFTNSCTPYAVGCRARNFVLISAAGITTTPSKLRRGGSVVLLHATSERNPLHVGPLSPSHRRLDVARQRIQRGALLGLISRAVVNPATPPLWPLTWFRTASMMCGCTPLSAMRVAAVRRRSCMVQSATPCHPVKGPWPPTNQRTHPHRSQRPGRDRHACGVLQDRERVQQTAARHARARSWCVAGRVIVFASMSISDHRRAADLVTPLTRQHQQANDPAIVAIRRSVPDRRLARHPSTPGRAACSRPPC